MLTAQFFGSDRNIVAQRLRSDPVYGDGRIVLRRSGVREALDRRRLPGAIVSNLVTWVWTGSAYVVPAAMAKAAVHAMTMSLAVEWGPYGIRVNAIAPGPFPTESAWDKLNPLAETAIGPTQADDVPLRRVGKMDELRHLMIFLMSDGCNYITGDTISIDGGHHLAAPSTFTGLSKLSKEDWRRARKRIQASSRSEKAGRSV